MEGIDMAIKGGYWLKMLEVDLTKKEAAVKPIPEKIVENFLGGRGLLHWLHYNNVEPDADPLGPENALIFATGTLNGTLAPSSGRFVVGGKSPLTGILGDANCGGQYGPEIKYAGYDAMILKGKSTNPVYINIQNDKVEILDAQELWGHDSEDTEETLRKKHGKDVQVACIGIGGENQVHFAGIVCNKDHLAARTGMGAVMGSKNLKAVVVRGTKEIPIYNMKEYKKIVDELWNVIVNDSRSGGHLPEYGTTSLFELHNSLGGLSTRNWQTGYFEDHDKCNAEAMNEKYLVNATACFNCPSRCDRYCYIKDGEYAGTYVGGPEYYTMLSFGSRLGNSDLPTILKANDLCNRYGLDTGSTGGIIAFAMECYEKGLLTKEMADGLDLAWGNTKSIIALVEKIAKRQGFGEILAQGFKKSVEYIGEESKRFAINIKGMDPPTLDPRALKVYNFRYAVASRGGDHLRISVHAAYELDKLPVDEAARRLRFWQKIVTIPDIMGVCKFPYTFYSEGPEVTFKKVLELVPAAIKAITGIEIDGDKLLKVSERVELIERSVNIRYGLKPSDDDLPERFKKEPMPSGPKKGAIHDLVDELKVFFYDDAKWDLVTGIPYEEQYEALDMLEIKEDLVKRGFQVQRKGGRG
jgi:aldehyde:ferredoxin oxidoreductase